MLSRVADSLYWMARYIERAENITRLLEVNLQLLLDFEHLDDAQVKEHWDPIIRASGDEKQFYELYEMADSQTVTDFLTFNIRNPNSVLSCIFAARENARQVRDQISSEIFETINNLYLFLRSANAKTVWQKGAWDFYDRIQEHSHLFQGLVSATISRDEGYEFMQFGTYMERADKTARILDVKYHMLLPQVSDVGGAVDVAQWMALLKSASAFEAYHRIYVTDVDPAKIAEFLIFSSSFPAMARWKRSWTRACMSTWTTFRHALMKSERLPTTPICSRPRSISQRRFKPSNNSSRLPACIELAQGSLSGAGHGPFTPSKFPWRIFSGE